MSRDAGDPIATVVLLTKNAGPAFPAVLDAIAGQRTGFAVEIVAIDSGSTDATRDRLIARGARVIAIPPASFGFSRTKNLAVREARGRYCVFLSQDARPAGPEWLAHLIDPIAAGSAIAVSGRQVAPVGTNPVEAYFLRQLYPDRPIWYSAADAGRFVTFSNVNCAFAIEAARALPFDEDLLMSEDQAWAQAALRRGWTIGYMPRATVCHAHNYSPVGIFRRSFDSGATLPRILPRAGGPIADRGLGYLAGQWADLIRSGRAAWLPYAIVYEACRVAGYLAGTHEARLPRPIRRRLGRYGHLIARAGGDA